MSKNTATKPTARRYDEATREKIIAFMKAGKTNREVKEKFGCTAHFAAHLRKEAGLPQSERKPRTAKAPVKATKAAKPVAKKAVKKAAVKDSGLL